MSDQEKPSKVREKSPEPEDWELDRLLGAWDAGSPPPGMERLIFSRHRERLDRRSWWDLGGTVRIPAWMATGFLILFLLMLPLAIDGLRSGEGRRKSSDRPVSAPARGDGAASMASVDGYFITVTDLSQFEPAEDTDLRVLRADANKEEKP